MRFNEGQQEFLDHVKGRALVSACSGAGKSSTLVERVRILVQEHNVSPNEIMVVTFTKNSADDLTNKLSKLGIDGIQCGTFHSICGRLLSKVGMSGKEVKKYEVDNIFNKILLADKPNVNEVWGWISYQKNFNKNPESEEFAPKQTEQASIGELRRCFRAYEDYKEKNNMIDMDDVLIKTLKLFEEDEDDYLDSFKVNYIMVDECLSGEQLVKTNKGTKQIKTLYDMYSKGMELPLILSYNIEKDIYEYKPMTYAHKSKNRDIYEVKTEGLSKIRCTDNHKLLTQRGYVEVKDIIVGKDVVLMDKPENQKTKLILNDEQLQILLGSFLGDGWVKKMSDFSTYRLRFTQGEKQFDYFNQKIKAFNLNYRKIKSGYTGKESVYQSSCTGVFVLHDDIWDVLENEISPLGLAIWYQDDGSLNSGRYVRLYSESFTYEENERLVKILNKRFGIDAEIKVDKKYYFLHMDYENSNKFLSLVSPFMHKSMQYKTTIDISSNDVNFNNEYKKYGGNVISSIELIGKGEVYDITVKDNHNFITTRKRSCSTVTEGSGMIVHNCQDSNSVQYELIEHFCKTENKIIIGDSKQSLYQFRGANPQEFINFAKRDDCKVINFNVNYRSCRNIVEHANTFCQRYLNSDIYVDAIANNQEDGEITHNFYYTFEDEAIAVAKKIKNMIDNGTEPKDICVLYRNNQMSQLVELELKQLEVPYYVDTNSSFFKMKEIETILCALRLIINKNDDLAFDTIFNNRFGCFKYIPASIIKDIRLMADNSEMSYIDASRNVRVQGKDWITRNMRAFADEIETLSRKVNRLSVRELVLEVIDLLEIKTCIKTNIYYDQDQKDAKMNALRVLDSFVGDFSSIDKLLTFAYSEQKKKKKDGEDNVVNLMTIHKSKGLEYKTVYLISNGKQFPSKTADYREEGNLFYVGITRAKENLHISTVEEIPEFVNVTFNDILNNALQEIEQFEIDD